jgi:hypothetical protein
LANFTGATMRQIAIITTEDSECYECDYSNIITSITEWSKVSDEDFKLLDEASSRSRSYNSKIPSFRIIERPIDEHIFIRKTVDNYKAMIIEEERRIEEEKRKRAEAKARQTQANAAKKIEKLRKELAKLESVEK